MQRRADGATLAGMPNRLKPVALHRLHGTYQPSRHAYRAHEPEALGELAEVKPPSWLNTGQKRIWREVISDAPRGILQRADFRMFVNYIVLADSLETAVKAQNKVKQLVDADGKPSPYLRIIRQTVEVMTRLQAEMGFTPVARSRLGTPLPSAPPEPQNAHQQFEVIEAKRRA